MAAESVLSVNLPPVQWTTGAAGREPRQDSMEQKENKGRRRQTRARQAARATSLDGPIEEMVTHEIDSFA